MSRETGKAGSAESARLSPAKTKVNKPAIRQRVTKGERIDRMRVCVRKAFSLLLNVRALIKSALFKGNGFLAEMKTQRAVITLGNGQLGLMLSKAAKKLGIPFTAMSLQEARAWLGEKPDPSRFLVTFEQEHVDQDLLQGLESAGIPSFPTWENFSLLKSKLSQKLFLQENGIPTSGYVKADPWGASCDEFIRSHKGAVLKAGRGGYDGKGVWLVDAKGQTKDGPAQGVAAKLAEPYLEERVSFEEEIAAVVCRSSAGDIKLYPTVRSIQSDGICYQVEYTKEFAQTPTAHLAGNVAKQVAEKLQYIGVLAVEFFRKGDQVLVNEIAPRVHNSGHFSIDLCAGSQFENHLRAGLGLELEKTEPTHPAALMVNLLWPEGEKEFAPLFTRLTCGPEWPDNVKMHWYGKSEARPRRKMGHFTVYGNSIEECRAQAAQILASRWG
jgi:5-(carboxyamino)imidazole ribonucleotide synthase